MNLETITIPEFRNFVGKKLFTVEFFKLPQTREEKRAGRGAYRKMNAMLGVAVYVKGTEPKTTAKREATNLLNNQIGCYEMQGTIPQDEKAVRVEEKNYRTIPIDPNRLISLAANGEKFVNPRFEHFEDELVLDFAPVQIPRTRKVTVVGKTPKEDVDQLNAMLEGTSVEMKPKHAGRTPEETRALALRIVSETLSDDLQGMIEQLPATIRNISKMQK